MIGLFATDPVSSVSIRRISISNKLGWLTHIKIGAFDLKR